MATPTPPPLERLLPYITSTLSSATSTLASLTKSLISLLTHPLTYLSPFPILLYLLAPLLVFLDILIDIFLRWPRSVVLYALDAVYPVYVFCGVACIVGVLVGGTGRLATQVLVDLVTRNEEPYADTKEDGGTSKRRSKRRVKAEEDD